MHNRAIRNGKIVDGTGAPAFYGDIAIDGALLPRMKQIEFTGKLERLRSNFLARIKHMPVRFTESQAAA